MKTKEAFLKYLDFGYQPILLHQNTKVPIFYGWQNKYNHKNYCDLLNSNKKYNIGFLLGNIVDIEGDTEEANNILNNYFLAINHPIYKSKKSFHHLYFPYFTLTAHRGQHFNIIIINYLSKHTNFFLLCSKFSFFNICTYT